jgi:hypothetical protein
MNSTSITPVYTGEPVANEHVTLYPEVVSLDGNVRVKLVLANGEELILPYEILPLVGQNANRMQGALKNYLEIARYEEYRLENRYDSTQLTNASSKTRKGGTYHRAGVNITVDSTPYITWRPNESGLHGWALTLAGIDDVNIGWAAWNDPKGVDELISNLDDIDSCLAIAAIVAPTPTAQMSARITAKALRSGRKLPGINVAKIRKIFEDKNLCTPNAIPAWNAGQVKVLAIQSGDKKVPIAVAISAPNKFVDQPQISEEELREMTWQQRRQAEIDILQPLVDNWVKEAKSAVTSAGWRLIDLDKPRSYYGTNNNDVFWATLINPELWSDVSAAAQHLAREFRMSRTTRL